MIRRAHLDDVGLLGAIESEAGTKFAGTHMAFAQAHPPTPPELLAAAVAEGILWVSVDAADRPVGFLLAAWEGDWLHIREMAVVPAHAGQGRGRALLRAARFAAHAAGAAQVSLTTDRSLPWNAPFYARQGFTELARAAAPAWLADILAREAAHGLRPEWRCAMVAPPLEGVR